MGPRPPRTLRNEDFVGFNFVGVDKGSTGEEPIVRKLEVPD